MKKEIIITMAACMMLSGCSVTVTKPASGIVNVHTSYFDRYSMERDGASCKVKGTLYQAAGDDNTVITSISVPEGGGSVHIEGSMECVRGSLQLIYIAPDGTQTLIAEDTEKKFDVQLDVAEGEGSIVFTGNEENAVCGFLLKMKAEQGVAFGSIMEEDSLDDLEGIEELEAPEEPESLEKIETLEELEPAEDIELKEIENHWSESGSIRYQGDGVYADPMSTIFEVDEPVTLSVSCVTKEGKLRLKIVNKGILGDVGEIVYFDETNPDGEYTVALDKAGTYRVVFEARAHVGSVEIKKSANPD